jgi:hypothetical protein
MAMQDVSSFAGADTPVAASSPGATGPESPASLSIACGVRMRKALADATFSEAASAGSVFLIRRALPASTAVAPNASTVASLRCRGLRSSVF